MPTRRLDIFEKLSIGKLPGRCPLLKTVKLQPGSSRSKQYLLQHVLSPVCGLHGIASQSLLGGREDDVGGKTEAQDTDACCRKTLKLDHGCASW